MRLLVLSQWHGAIEILFFIIIIIIIILHELKQPRNDRKVVI